MRYSADFDLDDWPLAFVQADTQFLSVHRYGESIAWRQHRSRRAALRQAERDKGVAVEFQPFKGRPRWEPIG